MGWPKKCMKITRNAELLGRGKLFMQEFCIALEPMINQVLNNIKQQDGWTILTATENHLLTLNMILH
jgi:hypothetical protein